MRVVRCTTRAKVSAVSMMTATQALVALVVACAAIVVGVALLYEVAWALIIGGSLLFVIVVVLYDSQLGQRRADQRRRDV